jgi:hypothetical protein
MKPNLVAFQSGQETQQQAIDNFNQGWGIVEQNCSNPQLGDAGVRCIGDRERGGKWDWFKMYLDPIQNSQPVVTGGGNTGLVSSSGTGGGSFDAGWLVALGVVGLAMVMD